MALDLTKLVAEWTMDVRILSWTGVRDFRRNVEQSLLLIRIHTTLVTLIYTYSADELGPIYEFLPHLSNALTQAIDWALEKLPDISIEREIATVVALRQELSQRATEVRQLMMTLHASKLADVPHNQ